MQGRRKEIIREMERLSLEKTLIEFSEEMKLRLFEKEKEGFFGWDDPGDKNIIFKKFLRKIELLKGTKEGCPSAKKIFIDISNFAMMLYFLESKGIVQREDSSELSQDIVDNLLEKQSEFQGTYDDHFDKYGNSYDKTLTLDTASKLREAMLKKEKFDQK